MLQGVWPSFVTKPVAPHLNQSVGEQDESTWVLSCRKFEEGLLLAYYVCLLALSLRVQI